MRTPMLARHTAVRVTMFAGALLLGACGEVTAPKAAKPMKSIAGTSMFTPTAAQRALIGVVAGSYSVTIDPRQDQSLWLGPKHLDIPANSVCNLLTSSYGPSTWNQPCSTQTLPVTITVVIKNSQSDHPELDFFPAMRFNPTKAVQLVMYVPAVSPPDAKNWVMAYCNNEGKCFNESETDSQLVTYVDYNASVLFRRIKHFSGYLGTGRSGCGPDGTDPCPE